MRRGIYTGSFEQVTLVHFDIIHRASKLVDELVIGVLCNKSKKALFDDNHR